MRPVQERSTCSRSGFGTLQSSGYSSFFAVVEVVIDSGVLMAQLNADKGTM